LRRYCQFIRGELTKPDGTKIPLFPLKLQEIQSPETKRNPTKFKLSDGYLEKMLSKPSRIRGEIVWKNFFFGTYKKKVIRNFTLTMTSANPTNFLFPEIFPELNSRIKFSKEVRDYFQNLPSP